MLAMSIESEAGANARFRLVRAALASSFALVLVILFQAASAFTTQDASVSENLAQASMLLVSSVLVFSLVATTCERLPRQFTAFFGVGYSLMVLGGGLVVLIAGGASIIAPDADLLRRALGVASLALAVPSIWLIWDFLLFFGWQFLDENDLDAVRGWRPKAWRLIANFQRQMGMPAFIAAMRGGFLISCVYLLSAMLNIGLVMVPLLAMSFIAPEGSAPSTGADEQLVTLQFAGLLAINALGANRAVAGFAGDLARRRYQKVRNWDGRSPIFFLRTFTQDTSKAKVQTANRVLGWLTGIGRPMTLDETLLEHGSPYGPVIAIGDPKDKIPPLGAARIFVSNDDWQSVVTGLVASSKAIVMCPTGTEGVRWELDHLVGADAQARTIYLASPELPAAESKRLFSSICGEPIEVMSEDAMVIALYWVRGAWHAIGARALTTQTYTVALNTALQAMFGVGGVPMRRPDKQPQRRWALAHE